MFKCFPESKERMFAILFILLLLSVLISFIQSDLFFKVYLFLIFIILLFIYYPIRIYTKIAVHHPNIKYRIGGLILSVFIIFLSIFTVYLLLKTLGHDTEDITLWTLGALFLYSSAIYAVFLILIYRKQKNTGTR